MAQVARIDEALAESRLTRDVVVYRGVPGRTLFGDRWEGDLVGFEWTDAAFQSTSVEREVAEGFGFGDSSDSFGATVLRVVVPEGTPAIQVQGSGRDRDGLRNEGELLLGRGLRFRVVGEHTEDRGTNLMGIQLAPNRVLDVEVIPNDPPGLVSIDETARPKSGLPSFSGHDGKDVTDQEERDFHTLSGAEQDAINDRIRTARGTGARETTFGSLPDRTVDVAPDREAEIRAAVEDIAGSRTVTLKNLREQLGDRFDRAEVDNVLLKLNRSGDWHVTPQANQKDLTPRARLAAVVIGNQDKHAIRVLKRGSPSPEAQAVARQAKVDSARTVADLTAEVQRLVSDGASPEALRLRINQSAKRLGTPDDVRDSLLSAAIDKPPMLPGVIDRIHSDYDLTPTGRTGDAGFFNPASMDMVGGGRPPTEGSGVQVRVVRPGYEVMLPSREVEVENRIRAAYRDLRSDKRWVGLAQIREHPAVRELGRAEVDRVLKDFVGQPGAFLEPEMNQSALTVADRAAAVHVGGENNHFLRLSDPSPRPVDGERVQLSKAVVEVESSLTDEGRTALERLSAGGGGGVGGRGLPRNAFRPTEDIDGLERQGLVERDGDRYRITPRGEEAITGAVVEVDGPAPAKVAPPKAAKKAAPAKRAVRAAIDPEGRGPEGLSSVPAVREVQVENRVRAAYRDVLGQKPSPSPWVGLADLRAAIGEDIPRIEVDEALKRMIRARNSGDDPGGIRATPVHNNKALKTRDIKAALEYGYSGDGRRTPVDAIEIADPSPRTIPSPAVAKAARAKAAARPDKLTTGQADLLGFIDFEGGTSTLSAGGRSRARPTVALAALERDGLVDRSGDRVTINDKGRAALAAHSASVFIPGDVAERIQLPNAGKRSAPPAAEIMSVLDEVTTLPRLRKVAAEFNMTIPDDDRKFTLPELREFMVEQIIRDWGRWSWR